MALGVLEEAQFKITWTTLQPGDGLFLFTDGVTEAINVEEQFFSQNRLETILKRVEGQSPTVIVQKTVKEVKAFSASAPQADDITLLAFQYRSG